MRGLVPRIHVVQRSRKKMGMRGTPTERWRPSRTTGSLPRAAVCLSGAMMTERRSMGCAVTRAGRPSSRGLGEDETDLPGTWPVLQIFLALDRGADVVVTLGEDEALQAVALGEAVGRALAVLPGAAREVAGDADIDRAVGAVRHNVDPSTPHEIEWRLAPASPTRPF